MVALILFPIDRRAILSIHVPAPSMRNRIGEGVLVRGWGERGGDASAVVVGRPTAYKCTTGR